MTNKSVEQWYCQTVLVKLHAFLFSHVVQKLKKQKLLVQTLLGEDDLVAKINDGWLDFDVVIATPDMMALVGRLGRVLGPRNLMQT